MNKTTIKSLVVALLISLSVIIYLLIERVTTQPEVLEHQTSINEQNSTYSQVSMYSTSSNKRLTNNPKVNSLSQNSSPQNSTTQLTDALSQLAEMANTPYAQQIHQINQWLQQWPYEPLLLMRLGKLQGELGNFDEAASYLYEALQYAQSHEQTTRARTLLLYTLNRYGKDLALSNDWLTLESLYLQYQDTLLEQEGWGELAHKHANRLLDAKRYQELEYFIQDWSHVHAAKADLNHFSNQLSFAQELALSSSKAIPLRQWGAHYLVTVMINDNEVNLLIDTGASQTVLTQDAYNRMSQPLNPDEIRRQTFNTAGGKVEGAVLYPVEIKINDFVVNDTSIALLEFNVPYDGLLGMNFLSQFEFEIDQQGHLLFLTLPD